MANLTIKNVPDSRPVPPLTAGASISRSSLAWRRWSGRHRWTLTRSWLACGRFGERLLARGSPTEQSRLKIAGRA
jgi:hypothetical protein